MIKAIKRKIKNIIIRILGKESIYKILFFTPLVSNYINDLKLFYRHSTVFKWDTLNKIESMIILDYHSVEKGLLFRDTKPRFAKQRIINLHKNLKNEIVKKNAKLSQIKVGYQIMCQYYELNKKLFIDISDYFTEDDYDFYKNILLDSYSKDFSGSIEYSIDQFYELNDKNFEQFSYSRKSIRNFTGEKIDITKIKNAIQLALNAPSVCNRQSSKVYLLENKKIIDKVLKIQGGFTGYIENVSQLLILTVDRNYFYTVGERNQMFIDGGLFLMNLLYSLHYFKIANCPANWGKTMKDEKLLSNFIKIPASEKIICLIPIGKAEVIFRVTLSQRRDVEEIFSIINIQNGK